jgi:hypothetical protein
MDYGKNLSRAWDLVWKNKFLILLGVLVILGSGSGSGGGQGLSASQFNIRNQQLPRFDVSAPFRSLNLPVFAAVGLIFLISIAVLFGIALWAISTISRGGLIYGANAVNQGKQSGFSESFRAGWEKGWRLIGIGLVPAIPVLMLVVGALFSAGFYINGRVITGNGQFYNLPGLAVPLITATCVLVLMALILSLLRTFANRACMLEDTGVFASYRRGLEVLGENLGPAIVLFLLQIALSIGIGLVLLLPGILIALCCFLWPLLLLIQGTFAAFYSTLWTLAWNEWTRLEFSEEGMRATVSNS